MQTITIPGLEVLNDGSDEAAWLEARAQRITATAIAAIAGTHPYRKLLDVWNRWHDATWAEERNWRLEERADLGVEREPEIVEWAGEELRFGLALIHNTALYAAEDGAPAAATPDAFHVNEETGEITLVEAKTAAKDWKLAGIPAHVYDQAQWQLRVVGPRARKLYVALEVYSWKGGVATLERKRMLEIPRDETRLKFLEGRAAQFLRWVEQGIAPESDLDLASMVDGDDFERAAWAADRIRDLTRIAAIDREIVALTGALVTERDTLAARTRLEISGLEGRRVHLIAPGITAKLVRSVRSSVDQGKIPNQLIRAATSWKETDTVKLEITAPIEGVE